MGEGISIGENRLIEYSRTRYKYRMNECLAMTIIRGRNATVSAYIPLTILCPELISMQKTKRLDNASKCVK